MPHIRSLTLTLALMFGFAANASKSCSDELETVALRNGSTADGRMVSVIAFGLETLAKNSPDAFRDLIERARDPLYPLAPETLEKIGALGLLDAHGNVDGDVRNVALSSARPQGSDVVYVSPIAPVVMSEDDLHRYFERTDDFARDVVALGDELDVRLNVDLGDVDALVANRIAPNGALALRLDADGVPVHFVTPRGARHAFTLDDSTDPAKRTAFAEALVARFGLKPMPTNTALVAVTKDVHASPLPDPEPPTN